LTRLQAEQLKDLGSIFAGGHISFPSPKRPAWLWGSPDVFPRKQNSWGVKLATSV
jgi:hypothetical protein